MHNLCWLVHWLHLVMALMVSIFARDSGFFLIQDYLASTYATPAAAAAAPTYPAAAPAYSAPDSSAYAAPADDSYAPAAAATPSLYLTGPMNLVNVPSLNLKPAAYSKPEYKMPVAVANLFCTSSKYPCSCTLYLTQINKHNMLISGVCSGKKFSRD